VAELGTSRAPRAGTAMLELGAAIAQVAITMLAAAAVGGWILGRRFTLPHPALQCALQIALGALAVSYAVHAIVSSRVDLVAALKVLYAVLGLIVLVSAGSWARRLRARRGAIAATDDGGRRTRLARSSWPIPAAAAYVAWAVLCATLPAAAPDELIHHLAVPRRMLDEGAGVLFADNIYAWFPALGEMLFLFGLAIGGELAARLFHTALGLCAALALFGFCRRHLPAPPSWWAVAIFLTVPSVMVVLPWAYVDLIFTLYALLALVLMLEFFDGRQVRWAALGGVMAGGALATKYTGVPLVLTLALMVLVEHAWRRRTEVPAAAVAVAGAALAVASPYLWRNWRLTGWPLFPFAYGTFGLRPWINWDADREALFLTMLASYGSSASPAGPASAADAIAAPVLVFLRAQFGDPRWYDGVVGPVFLLAPLILWRRDLRARFAWPLIFAIISVLFWGITIRQVRFLIPVLPLLAFLVAAVMNTWRPRLAGAIVAGFALVGAGIAVNQVRAQAPWAFWRGAESRDAYLARQIAVYPIYQAANRQLGESDRVYLLNLHNYGFYLRRPWRADFVFESWRLEQAVADSGGRDVVARFFDSQGVTHLLIDERASAAAFSPGLRAAMQRFLTDRATRLVQLDGGSLYRLEPRRAPPARP
jgi:4-amino-4-deoxy-L-arabinose transferase-like glycosyltransferase